MRRIQPFVSTLFLLLENKTLERELRAETVKGPALPLERIDNVHRRHRLPMGVLRVNDRVADDVRKEDHKHAAGLLVDESGDSLDTFPPCESPDGRL